VPPHSAGMETLHLSPWNLIGPEGMLTRSTWRMIERVARIGLWAVTRSSARLRQELTLGRRPPAGSAVSAGREFSPTRV
jgi:hypothetical protein